MVDTKTEPVEAVFLGLDPAKHKSGATILLPEYGNTLFGEDEHPFDGRYFLSEYGKVTTQPERERYVETGFEHAQELDLPLVVVAEEWDPPRTRKIRTPGGGWSIVMDQKWTYKTVLGIGEGWGLWNAELLSAGVFLAEKRLPPIIVERVTPNDWRNDLWGRERAKDSEGAKSQAQVFFEALFGYSVPDDIAEAGCIAIWGTTSSCVAEAVQNWKKLKTKKPKRRKRRTRAS